MLLNHDSHQSKNKREREERQKENAQTGNHVTVCGKGACWTKRLYLIAKKELFKKKLGFVPMDLKECPKWKSREGSYQVLVVWFYFLSTNISPALCLAVSLGFFSCEKRIIIKVPSQYLQRWSDRHGRCFGVWVWRGRRKKPSHTQLRPEWAGRGQS